MRPDRPSRRGASRSTAASPTLIAPGIDRPAVSPDGRLLAGINVATGANRLTLVTMPLDGSAPPRELGTIAPATANGLMEWTPDGNGILFSTVERTNVWLQPLSGEPPVRVTDLATLDIVRGRRTPDGKSLIVARGSAQTDAYLGVELPLDVRVRLPFTRNLWKRV